jgi:hypothetical protein
MIAWREKAFHVSTQRPRGPGAAHLVRHALAVFAAVDR